MEMGKKRRIGWYTFLACFVLAGAWFCWDRWWPINMNKNESAVIAACRMYCSAQNSFRKEDRDGDGVLEYAQVLHGGRPLPKGQTEWQQGDPVLLGTVTKPTQGLYQGGDGSERALISRAIAEAEEGPGAKPYYGYYFRVLTHYRNPTNGAIEPCIDRTGRMTIRNGLLAYPAKYGRTGWHCYQVNVQGTGYRKNFGSVEATKTMVDQLGPVFDPCSTDPNQHNRWDPGD